MAEIGTTEAAFLLGISCQRMRLLLNQGRIKGARKVGRYWLIPLFKEMPVVTSGRRGPKGIWCKRPRRAATYIHVNGHAIAYSN